jgi:hypothetical protein
MANSPISPRLIRWALLIEAPQSSRIRRASIRNDLPAGVSTTPLRRLSKNSIPSSPSRSKTGTKRREFLILCIECIFNIYYNNYPRIPVKLDRTFPRSPDTFDKWSDQHRAQVWDMIERLAKGEVSHKEAREVLRQEMKALNAISKQVFRFKRAPVRK